jgi:predicted TIM-barrel fold metal-dependent hydrolase
MPEPFVADFEAYMPDEFNGRPYGKAGVLATAEEAGIDVCVVFPGGLPVDPAETNMRLLEAVRGESRIIPGCLINPTLGAAARDEVKRCVEAGARTVKLMAAAHKYVIDAPCVDPVMETARTLGVPVTIHSGSPESGCSPASIGRLARRHTEATIIMDHMGYREWVGLALDAAAANPNIYLGTTLIAAAEPIMIKHIVREGRVGADRIVFGSNAPSGVAAHGVNGIRAIGFNRTEEALILGGNLKRIYGL